MKNSGTTSVALRRQRVPKCWRNELDSVLIDRAALRRRVRELAQTITTDFAERDLVVVALLTGTVLFLADLIRELAMPLHLDFIGVSSYGSGTKPGRLTFNKELRLDVRGRDVLIVDDILDTGRTLHAVTKKLKRLKPRRLKVCVLLEKKVRRVNQVRADYVGFLVPDLFVVGYGLDFAERYRNLPFIGVLRPEMFAVPSNHAV